MKINCILCGTECDLNYHPYPEIRYANFLCDKCSTIIKQREKKTYGWLFHHFLKLEKNYGKIIIKNEEPTNKDKYGLQSIGIDMINNLINFHFYGGRHTRRILVVSLKDIESKKEQLLSIIRKSHRSYPPIHKIKYPIERDGVGIWKDGFECNTTPELIKKIKGCEKNE